MKEKDKVVGLEIPCVEKGSEKEKLILDTREDKSLHVWRRMADKGEKGFSWKDGLLFKSRCDFMGQVVDVLVLPAS